MKANTISLVDDGVAGVNIGHLSGETELLTRELQALLALYPRGIKPTIDSTCPFDEIAEAHRRMQERKNVGKIVLCRTVGVA